MSLVADPIDGRLDGAVDELDDENEQHGSDEECAFHTTASEPQTHRYDEHGKAEFLAKCRLVAEGSRKAPRARTKGKPETHKAAGLVAIYTPSFGFHVRSSCFAARTSSRRRTGRLWGAPFTDSGSSRASRSMWIMASANASSTSRLSVSVGSINRHSGTMRGK